MPADQYHARMRLRQSIIKRYAKRLLSFGNSLSTNNEISELRQNLVINIDVADIVTFKPR